MLTPNGVYVSVGSTDIGKWFAWLEAPLEGMVLSHFVSPRFVMILAELNLRDLATLGTLIESGKLTPVIDRKYKLSEAAEAMRYLEKAHARGKMVLTLE